MLEAASFLDKINIIVQNTTPRYFSQLNTPRYSPYMIHPITRHSPQCPTPSAIPF